MKHRDKREDYKFEKADRLLKRRQFLHLADKGRKTGNWQFIVFFEASSHRRSRLGITVSRKVGNAVTRNRIKRIARESFRTKRNLLQNHWDIHLIAKRSAAECSNEALTNAMEMLLKRIDAFKNN
ncbi:MAG: ribonuclease P protein component [Desulfatitalea sp.]|nr:ribonuclease P protein component [Desulfatitalea sp.]NNK01789.1 ribonuclease P protein component [Desulfatitalea sp.]